MPGPVELPAPQPKEASEPKASKGAGPEQSKPGHETAQQLQGDLTSAKNNGEKRPAGTTLKKLAGRAYARVKKIITGKPNSTADNKAQPADQEAPTPPAENKLKSPELKMVIPAPTDAGKTESSTVHAADSATKQEKSVLANISSADVKGGDAPGEGPTSTETGNPQKKETPEDEGSDTSQDTDSEQAEKNSTPEERVQTAKDKILQLNPNFDFESDEAEALLKDVLTDPEKLALFEDVAETVRSNTQNKIDLANKQRTAEQIAENVNLLTPENIAKLTENEFASIAETLKEAQKNVDPNSEEGKRLHWALALLALLGIATLAIPAGMATVGQAAARQN